MGQCCIPCTQGLQQQPLKKCLLQSSSLRVRLAGRHPGGDQPLHTLLRLGLLLVGGLVALLALLVLASQQRLKQLPLLLLPLVLLLQRLQQQHVPVSRFMLLLKLVQLLQAGQLLQGCQRGGLLLRLLRCHLLCLLRLGLLLLPLLLQAVGVPESLCQVRCSICWPRPWWFCCRSELPRTRPAAATTTTTSMTSITTGSSAAIGTSGGRATSSASSSSSSDASCSCCCRRGSI